MFSPRKYTVKKSLIYGKIKTILRLKSKNWVDTQLQISSENQLCESS
jgi:hypothetical protein